MNEQAYRLQRTLALLALAACALALLFALVGCGGSSDANAPLADGTYTAQSSIIEDKEDSGNGYGEITITVTDGAISDATFVTYELDGTQKGSEYGKSHSASVNENFYKMAQKAVAACDTYAQQLVEVGDPEAVDVVSGATINYGEFVEAAQAALSQARS